MIDEEGIQANSGKVGDVFIKELMKLRDEFEVVGDVRGKGLMLGLELVKDKVSVGGRGGGRREKLKGEGERKPVGRKEKERVRGWREKK